MTILPTEQSHHSANLLCETLSDSGNEGKHGNGL